MKNLAASFLSFLSSESLSLTWCWRIIRKDNLTMGFTSFDVPLTIDGVVYDPSLGFDPSAASASVGVEQTDSQRIEGILSDSQISSADIKSGLYDYAKIKAFAVNPYDLPANLETAPYKYLDLFEGLFGKFEKGDRTFAVELRGAEYLLDKKLGSVTSKFCRAVLGDSRCGVDLAPYTHPLTITDVKSDRIFSVSGSFEDKYFDYGRLAINGIERDIAFYQDNQLILFAALPFVPEVGQGVTAVRGCNHTLYSCIGFNNAVNIRSEPHVPLSDKMLNMPVSR